LNRLLGITQSYNFGPDRGLKEPGATIAVRIAMLYGKSIEGLQWQMILSYV
jgi:hypothetical protein